MSFYQTVTCLFSPNSWQWGYILSFDAFPIVFQDLVSCLCTLYECAYTLGFFGSWLVRSRAQLCHTDRRDMHLSKFTFSVVPGATAPSGTLVLWPGSCSSLSHTVHSAAYWLIHCLTLALVDNINKELWPF